MSGHSNQVDGRHSNSYERAIANLIASVILGIGRMIQAVFRTVFQILAALA